MKLATLDNGTRDGTLIVVRRDNTAYTSAVEIAPTLQDALDRWDECEPKLRALAAALEAGDVAALPVTANLCSPLRAYEWIDGSAYLNHVRLVKGAQRGAAPTLETDPLVYQGGSGIFLSPTQDILSPTRLGPRLRI